MEEDLGDSKETLLKCFSIITSLNGTGNYLPETLRHLQLLERYEVIQEIQAGRCFRNSLIYLACIFPFYAIRKCYMRNTESLRL